MKIDDNNELKLLSLHKTALLMKISVTTLKKLINEGRIKVITINKQMKIPYFELKRFIQENLINLNDYNPLPEIEKEQASENLIINTVELFNKLIQGA